MAIGALRSDMQFLLLSASLLARGWIVPLSGASGTTTPQRADEKERRRGRRTSTRFTHSETLVHLIVTMKKKTSATGPANKRQR